MRKREREELQKNWEELEQWAERVNREGLKRLKKAEVKAIKQDLDAAWGVIEARKCVQEEIGGQDNLPE